MQNRFKILGMTLGILFGVLLIAEQTPAEDDSGKINAYRALTEWGTIEEDVTWDASYTRDGAYYVSGDLVIEEDVTLTINRGTVVRIAPDHEKAGRRPPPKDSLQIPAPTR